MMQRLVHKIKEEIVLAKFVLKPPFEVNSESLSLNKEARILYVVSGDSVLRTPTKTFYLTKGDTVIINSGNIINNWIENEAFKNIEVIIFRLYPKLIENIHNDLSYIFSDKSINSKPLESVYKITLNSTIDKYIDGIQYYFSNQNLINEELITIKLREFLLLISALEEGTALNSILENLFNPTKHRFSEIIQANLFENISIKELSHLSGLSLSSFNRKFKEVYKESPKKYILTKRLNKAKELLARPDSRISEIAIDCCFEDPANFSKSFSSMFGISPSKYRKSIMT